MSSKKDLVGYIDPKTIDLELAYEMTKGWCFGEPPETFSFESDTLPKVIDFAELRKVKPPKGKSYNQVAAWLKKIADPETCPDSPRYKGCGNGWATNQPRWILTRLLSLEGVEW